MKSLYTFSRSLSHETSGLGSPITWHSIITRSPSIASHTRGLTRNFGSFEYLQEICRHISIRFHYYSAIFQQKLTLALSNRSCSDSHSMSHPLLVPNKLQFWYLFRLDRAHLSLRTYKHRFLAGLFGRSSVLFLPRDLKSLLYAYSVEV